VGERAIAIAHLLKHELIAQVRVQAGLGLAPVGAVVLEIP
jgi:hypothetical protein